MLALVDCNNFFVSCERVFNPKLKNKPVAVLSSNDGCIVARSNEVKALGVPMGAPVYQYRDIIQHNKVEVFSSNFVLYSDMSNRVMQTLKQFSSSIEFYSVDEAFLNIDGTKNLNEFGAHIAKTVEQWTGIPVSVGIAETKTLTKIANEYVKKKGLKYLCLTEDDEINKVLSEFELADIWGVGKKTAEKLRSLGIFTAFDLKNAHPKLIRKKTSVFTERTHLELNGVSCVELNDNPSIRKSMVVSRSFGKKILKLNELREALCSYVEKAAIKLRKENVKAHSITVFIQTNLYSKVDDQYRNSKSFLFTTPENDTMKLLEVADSLLSDIFKSGYKYNKAGVVLSNIVEENSLQQNLFTELEDDNNCDLMKKIDSINSRYGNNSVSFAVSGLNSKKQWSVNSDNRSRNYTTSWNGIVNVF